MKVPSITLILSLIYPFLLQSSTSHTLWYEEPATDWQINSLPMGDGRLGGMFFGQVDRERIMFNEDTLWIGDENDTGAYQAFGNIYVQMHERSFSQEFNCPSHGNGSGQGIGSAFDDSEKSKWCLEPKGKKVIADITYIAANTPLTSYEMTSANDVPKRDPQNWELQGSMDGKEWKTLDKRVNQPSWQRRLETKKFSVNNKTVYKHYRFIFQPNQGVSHLQIAGLKLNVKGKEGQNPSEYRRSLDISKSIYNVSYKYKGVKYSREAFFSKPNAVMVMRYKASRKGAHTGTIELADMHEAVTVGNGKNTLIAKGDLRGYKYGNPKRQDRDTYGIYLDYESQLKVVNKGGKVWIKNGKLHFKKCTSLTLFLAAGTNYLADRSKGWKGPHPHARLTEQISKASATSYKKLRKDHIRDYQRLYNRFDVKLAANKNSKLPTDKRLLAYQKDGSDLEFEALLVKYARYLMISSSRGSLPANLQGIWNRSNNPPWRCDFHSDVNVQMNYWFVDQTNLSECFKPFAEWLYSVQEVKTEKTKRKYGVRGWATQSENGIFGGSSYLWVPGDAAWLAQNIWDHYAFSKDKKYLKERAYPLIKGVVEYWEDYLIPGPNGTLISPKSVSPEHGPHVEGNSYEQQLVYDLFTNFMEASEDLGVDADYRKKIAGLRKRLLGPKIGRWGQLQEWMKDMDDPKNQHRHLSHLIAVVPGRQIAPSITPKLAKAAAVSLDARGDSGTGWSIGWKMSLWARLNDGNRAHRILRNALKPTTTTHIVMNYAGGTYQNLLMAHPPFQIEANFGYAAGFCEMLLQSHLDDLLLLPSLPDVWKKGKIRGLRARGDMTFDIEWSNGKLLTATVKAGRVPVRRKLLYAGKKLKLRLKAGESRKISVNDFK